MQKAIGRKIPSPRRLPINESNVFMITLINQRGLRTARLSSDNVAAQAQTSGVLANSARRHSLLAQRSATVRTLSPRTTTAVCFKVVLTSASRWGLSGLPVIWQKKKEEKQKSERPRGRRNAFRASTTTAGALQISAAWCGSVGPAEWQQLDASSETTQVRGLLTP